MRFDPFYLRTCEAIVQHELKLPFAYRPNAPLAPFEIADPFGLRKAVVPAFRREPDGRIFGMGTAFHVDGWGGFLTAHHVLDFMLGARSRGSFQATRRVELDPSEASHAVLLLGLGVVYGARKIPEWAFSPITRLSAPAAERDDPLADLRGDSVRVFTDIAGIQACFLPGVALPHTIPVRLNGWRPTVGEYVLAVGYPHLKPDETSDDMRVVEEAMSGAYGRITRVFPEGRDSVHPTPVFEVEADWPSGMSGGPVFNRMGEVVGVVSRSLRPDGASGGFGCAACLPWMPVRELMPSLDEENPGWRSGFGVLRENPWHLANVFRTEIEALLFADSAGEGYQVRFGSNRIGSDEFIW